MSTPNPQTIWQITGVTIRPVLVRRAISDVLIAVSRFVADTSGGGYSLRAITVAATDLFPSKAEAASEFRRRRALAYDPCDRRARRVAPEALSIVAPA